MSESNSTKALLGGITVLLALAAGTATYLGTFQNPAPSPELRKLDELVSAGVKEADASRQAARHAGDLSEAKAEEIRRMTKMGATTGYGAPAPNSGHGGEVAKPGEGAHAPGPEAVKTVAPASAPSPAPDASSAKADLSKLPPASGPGRVRGIVAIGGTRPPEREISPLKSDNICGKLPGINPMTRSWVGEGQGLANVFVYVKTGLEGKSFPPGGKKPVIDQKGCMYEPLMTGVVAGQPVEIRNSDPVLHNVSFQKSNAGNPTFNPAERGTNFAWPRKHSGFIHTSRPTAWPASSSALPVAILNN